MNDSKISNLSTDIFQEYHYLLSNYSFAIDLIDLSENSYLILSGTYSV